MKKLIKGTFKLIGFGILGIIALGVIIAACSDESTPVEEKGTETAAPAAAPEKKEPKKPAVKKEDPSIDMGEFEKIQNGMSYGEVAKIIGSEGEMMSETGAKGDPYYTVIYNWKGKDGISNSVITFQGDKVYNKAQIGLQ
jgi:hypothetical protein